MLLVGKYSDNTKYIICIYNVRLRVIFGIQLVHLVGFNIDIHLEKPAVCLCDLEGDFVESCFDGYSY